MNENEEKRTILIDVISIVYRFACVSRAFAHIRHLHTHTHRRQQLTFYHNYSVWHTFVIDIIHLIMIEYFDINVCASVACIHISSSLFGARAVRIMQNICYNNCLNEASSFFFLLYAVCLLHHRRLLPLSQSIVQCERVIWLNECIPIGSLEEEEKTNTRPAGCWIYTPTMLFFFYSYSSHRDSFTSAFTLELLVLVLSSFFSCYSLQW